MNPLRLPLDYSIHISPSSLNESIYNTDSVQPSNIINNTVCPESLQAVEYEQTAPNLRENNDILRRIKQEIHVFCEDSFTKKYLFFVLINHLYVISLFIYILSNLRDLYNVKPLNNVIFVLSIAVSCFSSLILYVVSLCLFEIKTDGCLNSLN